MPELALYRTCLMIGMSVEEFARMACLTVVLQTLAATASVRFDDEDSGEDDFLERQDDTWIDPWLADLSRVDSEELFSTSIDTSASKRPFRNC